MKNCKILFAALLALSFGFALHAQTNEMTIQANRKGAEIQPTMYGLFFEDINYAADGGLYAELIQNRGFEYSPGDKENRDTTWNSYKSWSLEGEYASFTIDTVSPIHSNNKHFAVLNIEKVGAGFANEGFDGIPVKSGERYDFSVFARSHLIMFINIHGPCQTLQKPLI